ncbi:DinB superfamily protein [Maioricimonas rarisocia]|uniref:DinB superfamily protein n=1 Tax=Maioricimonas rarisocia TaxID=2528026 RepID=A0A517Z3K0_9PLAN|nr:DinB family protein [Maioricimonas rarisocia]QDU37051.1 DinB superfamily protein [Maioricimonas rarisocia]
MNAKDAIRMSIDMGQMVALGYLEDLQDEEMMHRPHPGCNHIKWQLGHLITSEHRMMEQAVPGTMPALPDGFDDRYTKDVASVDDPGRFDSKEELLRVFHEQRSATLEALQTIEDAKLDHETGINYAPTVAAAFELQGSHWLMHAGQWAVIRRQLGREPLY